MITLTASGMMGTKPDWSGLKWSLGIDTEGVVFEAYPLKENREEHGKMVDTVTSLMLMEMSWCKRKK